MISFPRILFPTDFSAQSAATVSAVKAMARRFGSEVTVLHVIDVPQVWPGSPETSAWSALVSSDVLRLDGLEALDRFVSLHFSDMRVVQQLQQGDAAREIANVAQERHASLIMLPTRGYGVFRSLLLGSVTAKVLHDAHCPVWTGVHADELIAHPADSWQRVLCALDADLRDLDLLRWAASFAAEQALELRLVHAIEGLNPTFPAESDPGLRDFLFDIAREQIAKLQAEAGTKVEVCLRAGSPGRIVREAALGHRADLILAGRGVIEKRLGRLHSSAYAIIREAPCPVISM